MSVQSIRLTDIVLTAGTLGTKCGLVRLPCPLFTTLVLLIFTKILGDRSRDLTYGTVGELCTHSCFGASVDSSDSSSPLRLVDILLPRHKSLRLGTM